MASTSTLCPYCEKHTHTTIQWGQVYDQATSVRVASTCDNCGRILAGEGQGEAITGYGGTHATTSLGSVVEAVGRAEEISWLPLSAESPEVLDVPPAIARAAKEAYSSRSVGNHMAAVLMARTVVEATAKEKGITSGTLASKINGMRDADLIRPDIAELAHEVRFAGNDMAHGDIDVPIDDTDSEEILALMAEVLSEVFQGPARVARVKAKRQAK